jgi:hypothetical protein
MTEHHEPNDEAIAARDAIWGPTQPLEDIEPRAVGVRFDETAGLMMVMLRTGAVLGFAPTLLPQLEGASASAIAEARVTGEGVFITWPSLGKDVHVPALVLSACGSQAWCEQLVDAEWNAMPDTVPAMAAALGRKGGVSTSAAKVAAVRENGKKGGRPRKPSGPEAGEEPGASVP